MCGKYYLGSCGRYEKAFAGHGIAVTAFYYLPYSKKFASHLRIPEVDSEKSTRLSQSKHQCDS